LDGGSIGLGIVDRDGRWEGFFLPCDEPGPNSYSKVLVGAAYPGGQGAREIVDPEPTKRMLICILRDYPKRTPWDDYCLMQLRRHPVDFVRHLLHEWKGEYLAQPAP
jgi:hypothetical protein